jgi:hypothetical protein
MRRRSVVAIAALIAVLALAALPVPVGSRSPSASSAIEPVAFRTLDFPATLSGIPIPAVQLDPALDSAGSLDADSSFSEPGEAPKVPTLKRPAVDQPTSSGGSALKPPKKKLTGYASFYDNGTTAMRLPRGTVVVICGAGGCIQRTVNDYGPAASVHPERIIDMYRPDFFKICGCGSWSGTTWVTVSVY